MYIAMRVAAPELTRSKEQILRVSPDGRSARIDDFLIVVDRRNCLSNTARCNPELGVAKLNTQTPETVDTTPIVSGGETRLPLPVPISDEQGGLYTNLAVRWAPMCSELKAEGCGKAPYLAAHYEGTRLDDLTKPEAKGW